MSNLKHNTYVILLAGGVGTRLWPVSRELYPKQLVNFIGGDSLVQATVKRLLPVFFSKKIKIICGKEHFHEIARHMTEIGAQSEDGIICEPCGRNTAPAILLAVFSILKTEKDAILCVLPADHVIKNNEKFHNKLKTAIELADMGYIVTFGIKPNYPETGYGYIEGGQNVLDEALTIKRFVEKPNKETAKQYIEAGNFFWNSGMFTFKASVMIEEFKIYQPELFDKMNKILSHNKEVSEKEYEQLSNISIDNAIMEKTSKGVVLPSDFGWSDIGSWKSLYDFLPKDKNNNVFDGDVIAQDTTNCFIMGKDRLIAANHLKDIVVVETPDSVFVSDLDKSRNVKLIVAKLKQKGRKECQKHDIMRHQWGTFTVLDNACDCEIAKLLVYPNATLDIKPNVSTHNIIILKGTAKIISNGKTVLLDKGESTIIDKQNAAKIENIGNDSVHIAQVKIQG